MFQLLALILVFQAFCFYHIYSKKNESYWYIVILLFPLIGGIVYFVYNYQNRQKIQAIAEISNQTFESNQAFKTLENEAQMSDTVSNKIRLADAYMVKLEYEKAVEIYKSCMSKLTEDDEELTTKLLVAFHMSGDYLSAITLGDKLNTNRFFQNAPEKSHYAWSYFELHDDAKAETLFQEMNIPNTNYNQRKEFAKFLLEIEKPEEAKALIEEMLVEIEEMDLYEKELIKDKVKEIKAVKLSIK